MLLYPWLLQEMLVGLKYLRIAKLVDAPQMTEAEP
jgi:hypothetical protein